MGCEPRFCRSGGRGSVPLLGVVSAFCLNLLVRLLLGGFVLQPLFRSGVSVFTVCAIERDLEGLCSKLSKTCVFVFQFLTFSERLSNINIDIIHRIDRTGSYAEVRAALEIIF